ncbi:MAG: ATP-binding protein [Saprospiraceae bacterium]|nr:ATP-binding protein [Saprospiraceae bacterium]
MEQSPLEQNSKTLELEMQWLAEVIKTRMDLRFNQQGKYGSVYDVPIPSLKDDMSFYARIIKHCNFGFKERVVLALSIAPHIKPQVLDRFFLKNKMYDRVYTEFGGLKGRYHSGFLPTGETASFLIAGSSIEERIRVVDIFKPENTFFKNNILKLNLNQGHEPLFSSGLELSDEYLSFFTSGNAYKPDFSANFPAKRLSTKLDWTDLVLDPHVLGEVAEISAWLEHQNTIMDDWGLNKQLKKGYRSLFYGPPGTGKTLTACLLGKQMGLDVYRIDLSQVVSKFIGETEKNMANIFDQAENKNWILFFDEADALFGKRTATSDSKDRHSNQEVAYLLQRVEDFSGVVILATNLKANMDIAFTRRFQSIIYFPAPNIEQRFQLWENSFKTVKKDKDVDFSLVANDFKITGGSIINILRYCSLNALRRGSDSIAMDDITEGIKKELRKEGKTM